MGKTYRYVDSDEYCMHPEHEPPMHLVVKPGDKYTHKCPACKKVTRIKGK